jgi:Uma2 family endonuclease
MTLGPVAKSRGLRISSCTGLYQTDDDYRNPDVVVTQPRYRTKRGVEGGADFIVEILSPRDESYDKLPFYERFGVREALYVDPGTRRFDFFTRRGKRLVKKVPGKDGRVRSTVLDLTFATRGGRLEIGWKEGSARI